jgi:hypothetical protein
MVSVHLLDVLLAKHVIKYADSKKSVANESGRAKDAPAKAGEYDLGNCNFPLSTIRHTLATKSPRDDLMTETYSCTCTVFNVLCALLVSYTPIILIRGLCTARSATQDTSLFIHSAPSYADAAMCGGEI